MLVPIEFRVYLFYCTSHLCLGPSDPFYIICLHSCLVCALVRSASRSANVLSWAFIHLRSLFSTLGSVVLVLFFVHLHLVCCSKPSWSCWLELRQVASICGQGVASEHVGWLLNGLGLAAIVKGSVGYMIWVEDTNQKTELLPIKGI